MYSILKELINELPVYEGLTPRDFMTYNDYLKECRTIKLNMPRRVGKTRAIVQLSQEYSSLVITPSAYMSEYMRREFGVQSISNIDTLHRSIVGRNFYGLKYNCILIDEKPQLRVDEVVVLLNRATLLHKDFFIVQVGTNI